MKYITYNTQADGAGSQIQRIFSIYIIAKQYNLKYIHSPFHTTEHAFDAFLLNRFNQMNELPSDISLPDQYRTIHIDSFKDSVVEIIQREYSHPVLFKVNAAHEYFNEHPELLDSLFSPVFPWVETQLQQPLTIAVHIRRGDVTTTENNSRYIPLSFYLECMENLSEMFQTFPHRIELYSEGNISTEFAQYQERLNRIPYLSFHIDTDIVQTFQALVNAEILIAGHSSLSFSATMLKQKGVTIHLPFCCIYSKKHIEIHRPQELLNHRDKLFEMIGGVDL